MSTTDLQKCLEKRGAKADLLEKGQKIAAEVGR